MIPGVEHGVTEFVVLHIPIILQEKTASGLHPRPTGRGTAAERIKNKHSQKHGTMKT